MSEDKGRKNYWVISAKDYDLENVKVRDVYEAVIRGLKRGVWYASIFDKEGNVRESYEVEEEDCFGVLDNDGIMDVELTAKAIIVEFLENLSIIAMRYDDDMYEFVGKKERKWLDGILKDE